MEVALMIEGQNGLTWDRWQKITALAEAKGFCAIYRSDHFTNASGPDIESLECWTSLTWLASHSKKLEFGPLVSPLSFRHPAMLARFASAVDDLSGGRLRLGVGAGWQEREHQHFSFDLLDVKGRMDRLEEGLEIITGLLRSDVPLTFEGKYYQLQEAVLLPRPGRPGGPPIVIGGNGPKRTLPLVARFADEWNAIFLTPDAFREKSVALDDLLRQEGRVPSDVRRTMMTGCVFASSQNDLKERLEKRNRRLTDLQALGVIAGTGDDVVRQLENLRDAGLQRIMLQWLDLEDLAGLEQLADIVLPEFSPAG